MQIETEGGKDTHALIWAFERMEREIARLKDNMSEEIKRLRDIAHIAPQHRSEIIEECARMVESMPYSIGITQDDLHRIAIHLRALKEKP